MRSIREKIREKYESSRGAARAHSRPGRPFARPPSPRPALPPPRPAPPVLYFSCVFFAYFSCKVVFSYCPLLLDCLSYFLSYSFRILIPFDACQSFRNMPLTTFAIIVTRDLFVCLSCGKIFPASNRQHPQSSNSRVFFDSGSKFAGPSPHMCGLLKRPLDLLSRPHFDQRHERAAAPPRLAVGPPLCPFVNISQLSDVTRFIFFCTVLFPWHESDGSAARFSTAYPTGRVAAGGSALLRQQGRARVPAPGRK